MAGGFQVGAGCCFLFVEGGGEVPAYGHVDVVVGVVGGGDPGEVVGGEVAFGEGLEHDEDAGADGVGFGAAEPGVGGGEDGLCLAGADGFFAVQQGWVECVGDHPVVDVGEELFHFGLPLVGVFEGVEGVHVDDV